MTWRKASYLRKNVWQFRWRFVCSSAAACSSWVYSVIANSSTRLVHGLRARDHVTDATIELHWLRMRASINFKLCILVHRALKSERPINHRVTLPSCYSLSPQDTQFDMFILYTKMLIYNIDYSGNMMLPVTYVGLAYWSRYQAARCDWLQQNCLMNIMVLAQKCDNEAARRCNILAAFIVFYFTCADTLK